MAIFDRFGIVGGKRRSRPSELANTIEEITEISSPLAINFWIAVV